MVNETLELFKSVNGILVPHSVARIDMPSVGGYRGLSSGNQRPRGNCDPGPPEKSLDL